MLYYFWTFCQTVSTWNGAVTYVVKVYDYHSEIRLATAYITGESLKLQTERKNGEEKKKGKKN